MRVEEESLDRRRLLSEDHSTGGMYRLRDMVFA
jgi:hypothetical protein